MKQNIIVGISIASSMLAGCATESPEAADDEELVEADAEVGAGVRNEANFAVFQSSEFTELMAFFQKDKPECTRKARILGTACTVQRCPIDEDPPAFVDGGVITATNGRLTLQAADLGGFFFLGDLEPGFAVGDHVSLKATGSPDGAPALSARATIPAAMNLLAPIFTGNDDVFSLDRTRDLEVRWDGDVTRVGGTVTVSLNDDTTLIGGEEGESEPSPDGRSASIECEFDGRAGRGRVPARVLAKLRRGNGGSIFVESSSTRVTYVRDWRITAGGSSSQQARPLEIR